MKLKGIMLLAFVVSFVVAKSQSSVGMFAGYGSEIEKACFGLNAEIFVAPRFSLTPGAAFYLPQKVDVGYGDEIVVNFFEINGDVHGYLVKKESTGLYLLLGVNYVHAKVKFPSGSGIPSESDSETGVNIGVGANLGSSFYMEFKHETVYESQFVISGGFRIR